MLITFVQNCFSNLLSHEFLAVFTPSLYLFFEFLFWETVPRSLYNLKLITVAHNSNARIKDVEAGRLSNILRQLDKQSKFTLQPVGGGVKKKKTSQV